MTKVEPKNGSDFQLEELQKFVGGYIEIVRLNDSELLVVDEEGLLKHRPLNVTASRDAGFMVVGDVLRCLDNQVK